ncbi:MAG: SagB/ThcOx family dehydrogenase [Desulfitobacteriia bacterium]
MPKAGRDFWEESKHRKTESIEQSKERKKPPLELDYPKDCQLISLPKPENFTVNTLDLRAAIERRRSIRRYSGEALSLEELSFLLWSTQGVQKVVPEKVTFRTVPSAGACHAFETYILVNRVEGLKPGLYRFLAVKHALIPLQLAEGLAEKLAEACYGQHFAVSGALTFFWVAVKKRMIWRFGARGYRYLLLDAGHICQNLYLSALPLGCGACALGAFSDDELNNILGLDGQNLFVVYGASLGKLQD